MKSTIAVLLACILVGVIVISNRIDIPTNGNKCPYEGAECPNVQTYLQDYQIRLHMDTVWVYDYDRLVGTFINDKWDSKLDSIILNDNQ